MKRRIICAALVFVLSFSAIVFMGTQRLEAEDMPVVYVDPPSSAVSLGKNTTITIKVANVTDLYGYDIWMTYNGSILEVMEKSVTGPGQVVPSDTDDYVITDMSVSGAVKLGVVFIGAHGVPSFNGSGILLWVTFKGKMVGNTTLHLDTSWTELYDKNAQEIPMDPPVDGVVSVLSSPPVGGIWIPVDKFSLLAPYIALASTIILAVSISVAYIKYRKKQ